MPFVKTWSEEMVVEWLRCEGYFVEESAPFGVKPEGGRLEADVLGVKIENNVLEIKHIEVGNLTGSTKEDTQRVQRKFSPSQIIDYCKRKLNFSGKTNLGCMYVVTYSSKKKIKAIRQATKLNVKRMEDFIREDVYPAIDRWRHRPPYELKSKTGTLPDGLWLLHLLDYLQRK